MFEDSLLESAGKFKTKRSWTTALSLVLQVFLICILILIPLIYTEALPKQHLMSFLIAPPPPPPSPPRPVPIKAIVQTEIMEGRVRTPTKIPQKVAMIKEEQVPPPMTAAGAVGVPGGVSNGQMHSVINSILSSTPIAVPKIATPQRVRVSAGVQQGNLIQQVKPVYPQIAKNAHIQGSVVLQAEISKTGTIENLRAINGHPMLVPAALEAVKQWRYKPYYLNGEPVAVETTVTVNFTLSTGDR